MIGRFFAKAIRSRLPLHQPSLPCDAQRTWSSAAWPTDAMSPFVARSFIRGDCPAHSPRHVDFPAPRLDRGILGLWHDHYAPNSPAPSSRDGSMPSSSMRRRIWLRCCATSCSIRCGRAWSRGLRRTAGRVTGPREDSRRRRSGSTWPQCSPSSSASRRPPKRAIAISCWPKSRVRSASGTRSSTASTWAPRRGPSR
jgi:hypothetical protein